ncbi:MAG TPA: MBL fold metallo-hydrolase [Anaerolineaceae bacterium]|nr:MBL fold metallo-hydrolase [Anaerolineaceae bacterium]
MPQEMKMIDVGGVNCFLLKTGDGRFALIDTGFARQRAALEQELLSSGCQPGNLKLILLTHGDADHAGNAAYLRERFKAKIALHPGDAGMVERGDMNWQRKPKPDYVAFPFRVILFLFGRQSELDLFKADVSLQDGQDLADYGLDLRVLHLPGHSQGSVGFLTSTGDLYCGDLVWNIGKPGFHFIDDMQAARASVRKLPELGVKTVYPGHGKPFPVEKLSRVISIR